MNEEKEPRIPRCRSCSKEAGDTINVARFREKIRECFRKADLKSAGQSLEWWEAEARRMGDDRGLLTVRNEELGFYRNTGETEKAMAAVRESLELLQALELEDRVSGATVLVNAATTLKAFGRAEEGLSLYDRAEEVYLRNGMAEDYEYAALLNNKATSLCDAKRYGEAETCYERAVGILKTEGKHDADIALSLLGLCHLYYERDDAAAVDRIEATLDEVWEWAVSPRNEKNADYAYALTRCIPSLRYFRRDAEADVLQETSDGIYKAQ